MVKSKKPLEMLLISFIIILFVISALPQKNDLNNDGNYLIQQTSRSNDMNTDFTDDLRNSVKSVYKNHSPILIDGNANFLAQAGIENWDGDGSDTEPFVITSLNITNQTSIHLIEITNTDKYFEITNNLLVGGETGIKLDNVTNGLIANNQIANNTDNGISLKDSIENSIQNNVVKASLQSGIVLENSSSCNLINNDISNTSTAYYTIKAGITIKNSSLCFLSDNRVSYSSDRGIIIEYSPNCTLFNNSLLNNEWFSIQIVRSKFTNLTKNTVEYGGIYLSGSNNSLIYKNILFHADLHSSGSSHCNIIGNVLYNLSSMKIIIGEDFNILNNIFYRTMDNELNIINSDIHWNDFIINVGGYWGHLRDCCDTNLSHNFYDDWTVPDDNNDGIVDIPYKAVGIEDQYPLTEPQNPSPIHYVTTPIILSPKGDTEVNETVTVSWTESLDSFDHDISYSIYWVSSVQDYNNISWIEIATDILATSYQWNTSFIRYASMTHLRVIAHCNESMGTADHVTGLFRIDNQHLPIIGQSTEVTSDFTILMLFFTMSITVRFRFKKKREA